jgi:L,D-peptidoglycan transpeptidase YkuD (ErfK/YbiS/YcfS/YnhG family)
MDLVVTQTGGHSGVLRCGNAVFPCALGRGGVTASKREGDGATPAGEFPLRRALYRADKIERPETALAVTAIARADGWCDDPGDAFYNRQVRLPYRAHCESLWRPDGLYDLIVVLGHNDDPVVKGMGSAVFLHVAKPDFAATEGCVALRLPDLLAALRHATPQDKLRVIAAQA